MGYEKKGFDPYVEPPNPLVISLTTAVIVLGIVILLCGFTCIAYFVRRKYFPSEARILKKLGQRDLKPADLDRIVNRIAKLEYSEKVNKYS
jgi:hypothetical protein